MYKKKDSLKDMMQSLVTNFTEDKYGETII